MRNYEFTVIFDGEDEKSKKGLEAVAEMFKNANVTITKQDDMGIRQFAYPIKKQDKGHYVYYELQAEPTSMDEFEKELQLNPNVLKYLFVNKSK
ncbi:MAG: 30S ribosomal protein S6 [Sphaerochaeta sp.]|jgi:small subunit ribosomal protein S6|nr:30S ribosomal protein S6 [Sphaerochaeta sp.]MCH3920865.1 30S ribosomal protein S6 [Sphaerochaeta sp.]MCI2046061.1 30S ribosomal protein S6 [Sphaerochaeta sp.]MCI2076549.1 30S ribosomal protein S6 [Sphaerochaeta sp.]MCI2096720.1 30S ribosomal protein S6 [Sphaerochaeta sp.]